MLRRGAQPPDPATARPRGGAAPSRGRAPRLSRREMGVARPGRSGFSRTVIYGEGDCLRPLMPPSLRPSGGAGNGGAEPSGKVAGGHRPWVGEGTPGGAGSAWLTGKRWRRAPPPPPPSPPPHNCFRSPVPICPSPPVCVLAFVSLPCTDTLFQRPLLSPFTDLFCPINPSARGSGNKAPKRDPRASLSIVRH